MYGTVGRQSKQIRLEVLMSTTQRELRTALHMHRGGEVFVTRMRTGLIMSISMPLLKHHIVCHGLREWAGMTTMMSRRGTYEHAVEAL